MSRARPRPSIITFAGLRSRWRTPRSCAAASPAQICRAISSALVPGQAADAAEQGSEVLAVHVLHGEEVLAVHLAHVVDAAHVRVRHLPGQPRLREQARELRGVGGHGRRQELQGHDLAELEVVGAVHLAHASLADQGHDAVPVRHHDAGREPVGVAVARAQHGRGHRRTTGRELRAHGRQNCGAKPVGSQPRMNPGSAAVVKEEVIRYGRAGGRGLSRGRTTGEGDGMEREYLNLIGGQWTPAAAGTTNPDRNPARSEDVVAVFPSGGAEDARSAAEAAAKAYPGWARTPMPKRSEILLKAAALLEQRLDEVAEGLTREEGKTLAESKGETARGVSLLRYYAGEALQPTGEVYGSAVATTLLFAERVPLGPVALITPWNFPVAIPTWKVAPALAFGNTVVLKPAELDAADRLAPRGRAPSRRPASGRPEPGGGTRVTDRTGPGREPAHQGHQLHGLERRRRGPGREVRGARDQVPARDGRQEPRDRVERRRPRQGGGAHRSRAPCCRRARSAPPPAGSSSTATSSADFRDRLVARASGLKVGDGMKSGHVHGAAGERGRGEDRPRLHRGGQARGGAAADGRDQAQGRRLRRAASSSRRPSSTASDPT